ncbi:MAG: endonuclease III domain-containing protein [Planctomycetota bacterium]
MPKTMNRRASSDSIKPLTIAAICRRLNKAYGPVQAPDQRSVLDQLIATILSQNTSSGNSRAAFEELAARFPSWETVRRASTARIAAAIRRAGLSNSKAPRIKAILEEIHRQRAELSLEFLHDMPARESLEYLNRFPGVGPKTAACVVLFACGKPVLPVDTHVRRVSQRLGLIHVHTTAEQAHEQLARKVPARLVLSFHLQLIRHGRRVCLARKPRCAACILLDRCPEGARRLAAHQ